VTSSLVAGGPGGDGRGWVSNLVPAAPAAVLFIAGVVGLEPIASPVRISWWFLAAMFFVAEVGVVHVGVRRNAHSFSMSEIPLVLGLFFAAPWALVVGHLIGGLGALLYQRQSALELSFKLAQFCLGSSLATIVFSAIGAADPFFARGWVAAFVAVLAGHTATSVSMIAARSLNGLRPEALRAALGLGTMPVLATAGLALAAANLVWVRSPSVWLLLVPVAAVVLGSHAYTSIRARYQELAFLYETTREVQSAMNTEDALETLLRRAAEVFKAQRAEMVFFPLSPGAPAFRTTLAEDKVDALLPVSLEPAACERAVASFRGARLVAAAEEPELSSLFTAGIDHALIAPLVTSAKTNGVFLVGNGSKEAGFDSDDLELFTALADHAGVLLEKRSLQQSLHRLTEEIEERERTEQLLREAQAKYRSLVEDVPAIVYISPLSDDLPWSYVSPQIAPVLGYSPQEWLAGPTWRDRIHPEDRARVLTERVSSAGEARRDAFVGEYRLLAKDGGVVWVSDEATIVRREDQPLFYRGVLLDVTRRKQAEADKHALELQLRHAQKMEAIGELAGGVAHDFNNLLAVIRNYAQFVDEELDQGDPTKEDLAEILKASERATALVRQLLTFSRKEIIRPELIDLNQIVGELQTLLKRALRESITTVVRLEEGLAAVEMDPGQVHQLLLNLAVNAQDAMPDGGTLVFETSTEHVEARDASGHFDGLEPGPHACITVSDTGIGMSAEVKSRIFEPFFTTKGRTSGTGLGLSTVYGAIKRAGGDIAVYSREGLGTTFKIYLPARSQDEIPAPSRPRAQRRDGGRAEATVLVAEDEPGVRNVVERVLSQNGYRVLAAGSVNAALAAARAEPGPLHLLLTDVVMAGRSGRELAEEMAKLRPGIACLYMSGYPDEEVGRHGVLGSAEELLQKPFSAAELLAAVEACLEREGSPRS
jgi:PAS domain S-box-containing protein